MWTGPRPRFTWSLVLVAALGLVQIGLRASQDTFGQGAVRPGPGVSTPALLKQVQPKYTSEALRAKIQGIVMVEVVVLANGTVGDTRVLKSLDKTFGLDNEALVAARQWLFLPAKRDGQPVPAIVTLELEFRIHGTVLIAASSANDEFKGAALRLDHPGLVPPRLGSPASLRDFGPGVPNEVSVDAVISPSGRVERARLLTSIDAAPGGADERIVNTVRKWLFVPATLDGQQVGVVVKLVAR